MHPRGDSFPSPRVSSSRPRALTAGSRLVWWERAARLSVLSCGDLDSFHRRPAAAQSTRLTCAPGTRAGSPPRGFAEGTEAGGRVLVWTRPPASPVPPLPPVCGGPLLPPRPGVGRQCPVSCEHKSARGGAAAGRSGRQPLPASPMQGAVTRGGILGFGLCPRRPRVPGLTLPGSLRPALPYSLCALTSCGRRGPGPEALAPSEPSWVSLRPGPAGVRSHRERASAKTCPPGGSRPVGRCVH